jgi:hypothetical protein
LEPDPLGTTWLRQLHDPVGHAARSQLQWVLGWKAQGMQKHDDHYIHGKLLPAAELQGDGCAGHELRHSEREDGEEKHLDPHM